MARGVISIERVPLLCPIRKDLNQLAARKQRVEAKLDGLRYSVACSAGGEFGREIIHDEPAAHLDLHDLSGAMELHGNGRPVEESRYRMHSWRTRSLG